MSALWQGCDSSDEEVESKGQRNVPQTMHRPTPPPSLQLVPNDYRTTAWWTKPLLAAAASFRDSRGVQNRPLIVAIACSGTEAPCLAMQADDRGTIVEPSKVGSCGNIGLRITCGFHSHAVFSRFSCSPPHMMT